MIITACKASDSLQPQTHVMLRDAAVMLPLTHWTGKQLHVKQKIKELSRLRHVLPHISHFER